MESSFARGLRVMLTVIEGEAIRVDRLAERLELPVSTVYRYLRTLRELDIVDERDGAYGIGARLAPAQRAGLAHDAMGRVAQPLLQELADGTGETALLAVRVGRVALCIAQVPSHRPIRMTFELGQSLPLHAGATSRALLAHAPPEVVERVLAGDLPSHTRDTPDRSKLQRQIANTRATGFATSRGELVEGAFAVAVPVFVGDAVVAALALAGPATRCTPAWQRAARPALADAGERFGRLLDG